MNLARALLAVLVATVAGGSATLDARAVVPPPLATADALKELRSAFGPTRDLVPACERRQAALAALGNRDDAEVAGALLRAARQLESEVKDLATQRLKLLGTGSKNRTLQARAEMDPLRALQDTLHARLESLQDPVARQALVEAALGEDRLPMSLRIRLVQHITDGKETRDQVEKALGRRRKPATLVVAFQAVQALGPAGKPWLPRLLADLDHPEPVLREQSAAAVAATADPDAVEPLLRQLADEKEPATRRAIVRALEVLTRRPLGSSLHAWQRWWDENEAGCRAGDVPLGDGTPSEQRAADATSQYYSIPITGHSIVFLIDRSQSMQHPTEKGGQEQRIERAKTELIRALGKLPVETRFNIVTFAAGSDTWSDGLRPATPRNVADAKQWVERMKLQFGTALYDGVELAFHLCGRPPGDDFYSAAADTFFVLTDGKPYRAHPTKNNIVPDSKKRILADVQRWNLLDRVVIHTIGLGDDIPRTFLRNLATQNGGMFVE